MFKEKIKSYGIALLGVLFGIGGIIIGGRIGFGKSAKGDFDNYNQRVRQGIESDRTRMEERSEDLEGERELNSREGNRAIAERVRLDKERNLNEEARRTINSGQRIIENTRGNVSRIISDAKKST